MTEITQPADFDPIFSQDVIIVGGHAVNLWASYYAARGDEALAAFAPFTSKDADIFLKDKELAIAVAAGAGWEFKNNPEPRSPVLGIILMRRGSVQLQVDVLHAVTGLTAEDLTITESISFANGKTYSVPAPDVMLKAKLANLDRYKQDDRQDEKHVRILILCCAHYLKDTLAAVKEGQLHEREAVDRFMATLRVVNSAKSIDDRFKLGLSMALPARETLGELVALPKLQAFYERQMPRVKP